MSEQDLEVLITLDDPGEDDLEEDTFHSLQAENTRQLFSLLDKGADVRATLQGTNECAVTFAEKYGRAKITQLLRQVD